MTTRDQQSFSKIEYRIIFRHRRKQIISSRRRTTTDTIIGPDTSVPSSPSSQQSLFSPISSKTSVNPRADPIWKQIRIVLAVTGSFLIAWLPFHIRQIVLAFANYTEKPWPDFALTWLVISNSFWTALFCMLTDMDCRKTLSINFIACKSKLLHRTNHIGAWFTRLSSPTLTDCSNLPNTVV